MSNLQDAVRELKEITEKYVKDTISDVDYSYVYAGGKKYSISEDVTVYQKNGENYTLIKFADIMGVSGKNVHAYMSNSSLDKVRVIITE